MLDRKETGFIDFAQFIKEIHVAMQDRKTPTACDANMISNRTDETLLSMEDWKSGALLRNEIIEALQASLISNCDLYRELAK